MRNLRLACFILFFTAILPGCASFLAGQIVKGGGSQVSGNFDWTVDEPVCDNFEQVVTALIPFCQPDTRPGGLAFLAVPVGADAVFWNEVRVALLYNVGVDVGGHARAPEGVYCV